MVAVGSHARQMLGRTPGRIIVSRPMRDGVIADYLVTEAMLRYFIGKVVGKYSLFRPVVMVCIPAGVTNVESRAVLDATIQAGRQRGVPDRRAAGGGDRRQRADLEPVAAT